MGIKPPKATAKTDRYNNALQTFTEQIRFVWNTIIKRNGIELDETVVNASQKHLTVLEYKDKKLQEEIDNHSKQLAGQDLEISKKQNVLYELDKQIRTKKDRLKNWKRKCMKTHKARILGICVLSLPKRGKLWGFRIY